MRISGFKFLKIFDIEIFIDYSWIVIFLLVFWIFTISYYPAIFPNLKPTTDVILGFSTAILFFVSALFHELAHSLVSKKNNVEVKRITLFLFGGISELFEEPKDARSEFKIATAGPLTSVLLSAIFFVLALVAKHYNFISVYAVLNTLFQVNLLLAIFNLLPGFPLDGGRILRSIYWYFSKNLNEATKVASEGGKLVSYFLIGLGIVEIVMSGFFSGIWLILVGLFLNQAAKQGYMELLINQVLEKEKVGNLMKDKVVGVNPQLSIDELINEYFFKYRSHSFPVIQHNDIIGLVSIKDIQSKSSEELADARVWDLMKRFPFHLSVSPSDRVISALKIMIQEEVNFLPVKDSHGQLKGLITLESIAEYLEGQKVI